MAATLDIAYQIQRRSIIREVKGDLNGIRTSAAGANRTINRLGGAIIAAFSITAVSRFSREIIRSADSIKSMTNELRASGIALQNITKTQTQVADLANDTFSALKATNSLYARLTRSTKDINLLEKDRLNITRAILQSFTLSGASVQEQASGILQLSQGLASGVLRGEEYNSIAENASFLTQAIAKNLGIGLGELRQWSREGKLTTTLLTDVLQRVAPGINREFAQLSPTFANAWQVFRNGLDYALGGLGNLLLTSTGAVSRLIAAGTYLTSIFGPGGAGFNVQGLVSALQEGIRSIDYAALVVSGLKFAFSTAGVLAVLIGTFFIDVVNDFIAYFKTEFISAVRALGQQVADFFGFGDDFDGLRRANLPDPANFAPPSPIAAQNPAGLPIASSQTALADTDGRRRSTIPVLSLSDDTYFEGFGEEAVDSLGVSLSRALQNNELNKFGDNFLDALTGSILDRSFQTLSKALFDGVFEGLEQSLATSFGGGGRDTFGTALSLFGSAGGGGDSGLGGTAGLGSDRGFFSFQTGGIVPGGGSRAVPAFVHPGEAIFNQEQQRDLRRMINSGGGSGSETNNYNINALGDVDRTFARVIERRGRNVAEAGAQYSKEF